MRKKKEIDVKGTVIRVLSESNSDFISLTDMIKAKEGDFFIADWLRNRNTVEYLGIWESIHNSNFNYGEFATIKTMAGLNRYKLSVKEWIGKTNAIGLRATIGRYGGTYAHADIALEFGMWISPEFKVYLVKEFRRLKAEEHKQLNNEWSIHRTLSKINYQIHTDTIKEYVVPKNLSNEHINTIYASEADLLNVVLFGITANEWRNINPTLNGNIRDHSTLEQLLILANLESLNAEFIKLGIQQSERMTLLHETAISQMKSLAACSATKSLQLKQ